MRESHPSLPATYVGRARVGLLILCVICRVELRDEMCLESEIVLCSCNGRKTHTMCAARWRYAIGTGEPRCTSCRRPLTESVLAEVDALVASLLGAGVLGDRPAVPAPNVTGPARVLLDAESDDGFGDDHTWVNLAARALSPTVAAPIVTTPPAALPAVIPTPTSPGRALAQDAPAARRSARGKLSIYSGTFNFIPRLSP